MAEGHVGQLLLTEQARGERTASCLVLLFHDSSQAHQVEDVDPERGVLRDHLQLPCAACFPDVALVTLLFPLAQVRLEVRP